MVFLCHPVLSSKAISQTNQVTILDLFLLKWIRFNTKKHFFPLFGIFFIPLKTLLITADTIVWFKGKVISKPANHTEAVSMLHELSGSMHEVITGVCISLTGGRHTFYCSTLVWFAELSDKEINKYVTEYRPYDKAGAYGIQEWIGYIGIERIEGSYFNVMGLPVQKLYQELKKIIK